MRYKIFYTGFNGSLYKFFSLLEDGSIEIDFPSAEMAMSHVMGFLAIHPEYRKLEFVFLPVFKFEIH